MTYNEWKTKAEKVSNRDNVGIPSITRKQYQYRDDKLRRSGFLDWERFWLVAHRTNTPLLRVAIKERKHTFVRAQIGEISYQQYARDIVNKYRTEGWTFNDGGLNPFDMLEYYRDDSAQPKDKWPYCKKVRQVNKNFTEAKRKAIERRKKAEGRKDPHPAKRVRPI